MDSRGSRSDASFVAVRTSCPMVDDSKAEGTEPFSFTPFTRVSEEIEPRSSDMSSSHPSEVAALRVLSVYDYVIRSG